MPIKMDNITRNKLGMFTAGHNVPKHWRDSVRKTHTGRKPSKEESIKRGIAISKAKKGKPNFTQRGEKNNNWKGGITPLIRAVRTLFEYKLWRTRVFERDRFTCAHCGIHSGLGKSLTLHADHIKPFTVIMREYNISSIEEARSCFALWNIDNGRTLCIDCHKKTDTYAHKISGIKDLDLQWIKLNIKR